MLLGELRLLGPLRPLGHLVRLSRIDHRLEQLLPFVYPLLILLHRLSLQIGLLAMS